MFNFMRNPLLQVKVDPSPALFPEGEGKGEGLRLYFLFTDDMAVLTRPPGKRGMDDILEKFRIS